MVKANESKLVAFLKFDIFLFVNAVITKREVISK